MPVPLITVLAVLMAVPVIAVTAGMGSRRVAGDIERHTLLCALIRAHGVRRDLDGLLAAWLKVSLTVRRRTALIAAGISPLDAENAATAALSVKDLAAMTALRPARDAKFSSSRGRAMAMPRHPLAG
jgi:hypothetical protein